MENTSAQELSAAFKVADKDGNGKLKAQELKEVLQTIQSFFFDNFPFYSCCWPLQTLMKKRVRLTATWKW